MLLQLQAELRIMMILKATKAQIVHRILCFIQHNSIQLKYSTVFYTPRKTFLMSDFSAGEWLCRLLKPLLLVANQGSSAERKSFNCVSNPEWEISNIYQDFKQMWTFRKVFRLQSQMCDTSQSWGAPPDLTKKSVRTPRWTLVCLGLKSRMINYFQYLHLSSTPPRITKNLPLVEEAVQVDPKYKDK